MANAVQGFAKLWWETKVPVAVETVHQTLAAISTTWGRAMNRTSELKSPYAASPDGALANPLALAGFLAAFVATTVLARAAVTLYGRVSPRITAPLRVAHHIIASFAHSALFVLVFGHSVYYALPAPLVGDPATDAPAALQASPLLASLFHCFALLRVAECADTWLAIAAGDTRSPVVVAARCADIVLAWLLSLYAPGGPAVWLLAIAAAEAATCHAVSAFASGAHGPEQAASRIRRYTAFVGSTLVLVHTAVAGWLQSESPVCPRAVLRVAAIRYLLAVVSTLWHIRLVSRHSPAKRD